MAHKRPCSFQHSRCSRDRKVGRRILDQENQSLLPESEDFLRLLTAKELATVQQ